MNEARDNHLTCSEEAPLPLGIIIFGASGDLAARKLLPALFRLMKRGLLPEHFFILGAGRTVIPDDAFRKRVRTSLADAGVADDAQGLETFVARAYYERVDYGDAATYRDLVAKVNALDTRHETCGNHIYHLATPPSLYYPIAKALAESGLTAEGERCPQFNRVIFEKPFGYDSESARTLDRDLHTVLTEPQIYRIDHYLGKETVQNILMLRFANVIFEPVWNRQYIDNVQITVAESLGIGTRARYFDSSGLLRDMFQNHILQMLALVAMEPPQSFDANRVRDEKVKVMRSIRPYDVASLPSQILRAQYTSGTAGDGTPLTGYLDEEGVAIDSARETYIATRLFIDNWRWHGIPFYVRAGKRLSKKVSEIAITFKRLPFSLFERSGIAFHEPNVLRLKVQPDEGVSLLVQVKQPGSKICIGNVSLDFQYDGYFANILPDAYERLLLDAMQGDQTLFWRTDGVETAWNLVTPVLRAWEEDAKRTRYPLHTYPAGTFGPNEADALLRAHGHEWLPL